MLPKFHQIESIIETLTKTLQKSFQELYGKSFKLFMVLVSNLSSQRLDRIFHFKNQVCPIANAKTHRKVSTRFGVPLDEELQYDGEVFPISLKLFLKHFLARDSDYFDSDLTKQNFVPRDREDCSYTKKEGRKSIKSK